MKKQRTFYIDLVLAAICLLTLITGLIIHAAGHGIVQSNVKIWRVTHIVWGVLFLILSTGHIRAHRELYKACRKIQATQQGYGLSVSRLFTDKCDRPHPDIASGKCRHSFRSTALSGRYPVRHTGNLASVRTYENTPDNEKTH